MSKILLETKYTHAGWSKIQTFSQCPRKYAYKYLDKKKSFGSNLALHQGNMIHLALAHHYLPRLFSDSELDSSKWYSWSETIDLYAKKNEIEFEIDNMKQCVSDYIKYFQEEDKEYKIIGVEQVLECEIDGFPYSGRIDLIVEKDGVVFGVDHKTSAIMSMDQIDAYTMSGQFVGYSYLLREQYGERFGGMILNQIQHTNKPTFKRIVLGDFPNIFFGFPQTVSTINKQIQSYRKKNAQISDYPMVLDEMTCFHKYGKCRYINRCKGIQKS